MKSATPRPRRFGPLRALLYACAVSALLSPAACQGDGKAMASSAESTAPAASAVRTVAPGASPAASDCHSSESVRDWLTPAGCLNVRRCPGVPGSCKANCIPFPSACTGCASCDCLTRALCGHPKAGACKAHEVSCFAP